MLQTISRIGIIFGIIFGVSAGTYSVLAYSSTITSQVFVSQSSATLSGATNNMGFNSSILQTGGTITGARMPMMACDGTISNLQVKVNTAPGGGGSWSAMIRTLPFSNTSTAVSTNIACDISGVSTTCTDATTTSAVTAGQAPLLRMSAVNAPASTTVSYSFVYTPDTNNCITLGAGGAAMGASGQYVQGAVVAGNWSSVTATVVARAKTLIPFNGTIQYFYGKTQTAQSAGTGTSYVFRNETQNATTSLNIPFLAGNTTGSDTTNSVTVSEGDFIDVMATTTAGNTNASGAFGFGLFPQTVGEFALIGGEQSTAAVDSATTNTYMYFSGRQATTSLGDAQGIVGDMNIKRIQVAIPTAPGAAASRNFYLMVNGATTSTMCTIAGSATTTCTMGLPIHVNDGDLLNYVDEPVGSPATNVYVDFSAVGTRYFVPAAKHGIFSGFMKVLGGFLQIK